MNDSSPKNPDDFLGYHLIRRAAHLSERFTLALRVHGITSRQFSALALIASGRIQSNAQLAREIVVKPQSVGTILAVLQNRGLLQYLEIAGQTFNLELSPDGAQVLSAAYKTVERLDKEMRSSLEGDYNQILEALKKWPI